MDDVIAALRGTRGLRPSAENNFDDRHAGPALEIYKKLFGTFFIVGLALSSVGLLVGGVGVVAIMMISVTERTREIGVRKALGATRWTILWQFLVEAVTLTGIGASVGLVLGILVAIGVRTAWPSIPGDDVVGQRRRRARHQRRDGHPLRHAPGDARGAAGSGGGAAVRVGRREVGSAA